MAAFKNTLMIVCSLSILSMALPANADTKETIADTINNMSADMSCDHDDQCKSIGFGDKPCGGFQSYKIYSTRTLDETAFTALVKEYNLLDKQNNQKNDMVSTCEMLMEPVVTCVQGQCAATGISPVTY